MSTSSESGLALLEAIVAIAVLATAGLATVAAVSEAGQTLARAHATERETRDAAAFLEVVTLWPAVELDQRLGERRQGPWNLYIERLRPSLYAIEVRTPELNRVLLHTRVYKGREPGDGS